MSKWLRTPIATVLLLVLAAGLIGFGGIGAAMSAPRIESNAFGAEVELSEMSTSLVETNASGTKIVAGKNVEGKPLEGMVPAGEDFVVGRTYDEVLSVTNDGSIDEYVRVTVYKYWVNDQGKAVSLDPSYIQLTFADGWRKDDASSTPEREVWYYQKILPTGGSAALTKTLTISPEVMKSISKGGVYAYEGVTFQLKAVVDAVQTHNGTDAMTGAWGQTI